MKIVHIITRMILGGAQENTLLTCEGLHRRGHQVTLITGPALGPEGQLMDRAGQGGYKVIELNEMRRAINPVGDIPCYWRLKKLLRELNPDIVHTHSAKAGVLGRWAGAAICKKNGDKNLSDVIGRPCIVHTIHGLAFHPYQSGWLRRFYIAVERAVAKDTDAFISVAQAMTDQALAVGIGQAEQFNKVFSGMEINEYIDGPGAEEIARIRRELDIGQDAIVIATIARLFPLKGHEYVIASARQLAHKHKNVIWLFIGDGILRKQIEKQIAQAHLQDCFRLAGLVRPERIGELLHASDILVHPSLREGLARALPQAMLCAKPVISFDIDGASEVVNERTGFLIPPKNIAALVDAQEKLIEDSDLRKRLGMAGQQLCKVEFDHQKMVEKIEQIYKNLLNQ